MIDRTDTVTGPASSALNANIFNGGVGAWQEAALYRSVSMHIVGSVGITAGAIIFEQTNDLNAKPVIWPVEEVSLPTGIHLLVAQNIAANASRMFAGAITARYVRVRISTVFVGGTVQAVCSFSDKPYTRVASSAFISGTPSVTVASGTITTIGNAGTPAAPATPYFLNSAATTNAALIVTGTSGVESIYATNVGAAPIFVKLYNKAIAPIAGTDVPEMIIPVTAAAGGIPGSTSLPAGHQGYRFPLGLGIAVTGGAADSDVTPVAAGQVKVKLSRHV